ncbi:TRAP-type mannitol/chloroaromatic compound transport system, small permease component [Tistlia consotensis]|uniref:TRAP transporter small permease protein n=1 Tax=Tistlia consotensis USBA 355 TaxID=560819 RepID=A0A1Y6CHM9_9PROT|nr:TRAP transporter small permease subunit [Tistlia consotensis]SMF53747.1 TRAP-type mannitol/chloroaromatic compound transport system, small permease component [Tistlia consotensis USBA 355]SNR85955.1 TRAP-type mannitol/chloroaromatic compound transport system, small permease component [Tistlia consotensis]
MRSIVKAIERVTTNIGYVTALIVLPLALATVYDVFARYVLLEPTIWAFELGYTLTGAHFLLGAAITLQRGGHIRIDLIYAKLPPRWRAGIDLVCYLFLLLPFLVLLTDTLANYAWQAIQSGERTGQSAWNPPIWPLRVMISSSFALLGLQVVAEIIKSAAVLIGRPLDLDGDGAGDLPAEMSDHPLYREQEL